jgi:hypothetical protein
MTNLVVVLKPLVLYCCVTLMFCAKRRNGTTVPSFHHHRLRAGNIHTPSETI